MADNSNGINLSTKEQYLIGNPASDNAKFESFITSELRAFKYKFVDPLNLNFKLLVDFNKPYGLFAQDTVINSALSYLKRIGENERYEMLKRWIEIFKIFIRQYDFLILSCDGVDEIINKKPGNTVSQDAKITINVRETIDMLFQSLLTTYRKIWYDDERMVEVIPINLRRFDIGILIYSGGYYNMALYDAYENYFVDADNQYQTKILPTIKKLSEKFFLENSDSYDFNHHLIIIGDAEINTEESSKGFFSTLSNEPSDDYIKNTLCFNYRFANYKGIFNNIFGEFDFVKLLAVTSAQNKLSNTIIADQSKKNMSIGGNNTQPYQETASIVKNNFKNYFAKSKQKFSENGKVEIGKIAQRPTNYLNKLISKNSVIGNAFINLTNPDTIPNLIKNTIDLGIDYVDNTVYGLETKLNNMVFGSYSDNLVDLYKNYISREKNDSHIKYDPTLNLDDNSISNNENKFNGIEFQKKIDGYSNIFNRNGF